MLMSFDVCNTNVDRIPTKIYQSTWSIFVQWCVLNRPKPCLVIEMTMNSFIWFTHSRMLLRSFFFHRFCRIRIIRWIRKFTAIYGNRSTSTPNSWIRVYFYEPHCSVRQLYKRQCFILQCYHWSFLFLNVPVECFSIKNWPPYILYCIVFGTSIEILLVCL